MSNVNSRVDWESGITPYLMQALADSGDRTAFTSQAIHFSESDGNSPDVRPDGVLTGLSVIPSVSGSDNVVDIPALTCYLAGVKKSVSAGVDQAITRASTDKASVSSITINSSGAIAIVKGVDSADDSFSEVRGDPGAHPFIPVGSIEIAQVRTTTNVAGPITSAEIFQVPGTHLERSDFPVYTADNLLAQISFNAALPAIHTGGVPKGVYASYADPVFIEQPHANDFVPAEVSYSVSSEQVYKATIGSSSSSLGQGSFTAILKDGITDPIVGAAGQNLWFRYYQDENKTPHILTQGILGVGRTFGAADNPKVSCTITASQASSNRAS